MQFRSAILMGFVLAGGAWAQAGRRPSRRPRRRGDRSSGPRPAGPGGRGGARTKRATTSTTWSRRISRSGKTTRSSRSRTSPSRPIPNSPLAQQKKYMVLFFDHSSMNIGDQMQARQAAAKFIDANAGPNRLMAVVNFGGALQISQNFTDDIERLKAVVSGAKISAVSANDSEIGARRAAAQLGGRSSGCARWCWRCATWRRVWRDIPGRKTLVLFSAGFPLTQRDPIRGDGRDRRLQSGECGGLSGRRARADDATDALRRRDAARCCCRERCGTPGWRWPAWPVLRIAALFAPQRRRRGRRGRRSAGGRRRAWRAAGGGGARAAAAVCTRGGGGGGGAGGGAEADSAAAPRGGAPGAEEPGTPARGTTPGPATTTAIRRRRRQSIRNFGNRQQSAIANRSAEPAGHHSEYSGYGHHQPAGPVHAGRRHRRVRHHQHQRSAGRAAEDRQGTERILPAGLYAAGIGRREAATRSR